MAKGSSISKLRESEKYEMLEEVKQLPDILYGNVPNYGRNGNGSNHFK